MNLRIDTFLPCRRRVLEVEQELGDVIQEAHREIKRRELMIRMAERAAQRVKEGAPSDAVLREIARLQRLMRDEREEEQPH